MAGRRFCYLCGVVTDDFIEGLCHSCYLKENKVISLPEEISGSLCRDCGCYYLGSWERAGHSVDEIIQWIAQKEVESHIKSRIKDYEKSISILNWNDTGKKINADVKVSVNSNPGGLDFSDTLVCDLKINKVICPDCNKRAGGYYEAILQLRGDDLGEVMSEAIDRLALLNEKDRLAFVVEEAIVKGGIDLKIGSSKAAKILGAHFKNHYGAQTKESATLIGRKDGKDLYRRTVLIRFN